MCMYLQVERAFPGLSGWAASIHHDEPPAEPSLPKVCARRRRRTRVLAKKLFRYAELYERRSSTASTSQNVPNFKRDGPNFEVMGLIEKFKNFPKDFQKQEKRIQLMIFYILFYHLFFWAAVM